MKKPTELFNKAIKAGCETITDYVAWAYAQGQKDTYDEVLRDMEKLEGKPTIPDYMNKAITEGVENERR